MTFVNHWAVVVFVTKIERRSAAKLSRSCDHLVSFSGELDSQSALFAHFSPASKIAYGAFLTHPSYAVPLVLIALSHLSRVLALAAALPGCHFFFAHHDQLFTTFILNVFFFRPALASGSYLQRVQLYKAHENLAQKEVSNSIYSENGSVDGTFDRAGRSTAHVGTLFLTPRARALRSSNTQHF